MYDETTRAAARRAITAGESLNAISRRTGISRAALRDWRDHPEPLAGGCPRCEPERVMLPRDAYAHLLGLYLGDGCVSALRKGVYSLRVACDDSYPRLIDEAEKVVARIHPARPVHLVHSVGCTYVTSLWKHWPCLFPQHGPGMKHTRPIALVEWQQRIVEEHTGLFVRGLFNSDGCRVTNRTTRVVGGEAKRYEYPRYFFANESVDIMRLCSWALDRLGVEWRMARPNRLSVARREAVARLDEYVGGKGGKGQTR